MNLDEIPHDQFIQEAERRLSLGVIGFNGLYSTNQQDWREGTSDFADWLNDMCNADFETYQPIRAKLHECLDRYGGNRVQNRRQVFAVNTTYYGQDADRDHQPK